MTDLVFTSELALKRSIRKKYPCEGMKDKERDAVWEATFEDQRQWIGVDVEEAIAEKYEEYKEKEQQDNPV